MDILFLSFLKKNVFLKKKCALFCVLPLYHLKIWFYSLKNTVYRLNKFCAPKNLIILNDNQ